MEDTTKRDIKPSRKARRILEKDGYASLYRPEHPRCDHEGYVKEHRIIYEEFYDCCLLPFTVIHHKNKIRDDNHIWNLEPMYNSLHVSQHVRIDTTNRKCSRCDSKKTRWYRRKFVNSYGWYKDGNGGFICKRCYERSRLLAI